MKKYYLILFLSIFSITQAIGQVTGSLTITGNGSARTADWLGMFKTNKAILVAVNSSNVDYLAILDIEIYNGSGTLIARSRPERQIPITISVGATQIDVADAVPNDAGVGAMELIQSSYFDPLGRGFIPEDNYQVCINLLDVDTQLPLFRNNICRIMQIRAFQAPILLMPTNGFEVDLTKTSRPVLRWTAVTPRALFNVRYRVQVYEVRSEQTPEIAFLTNPPILDETVINITQMIWPPQYELPRKGYRYVWSVQALDEELIPLGEPNGRAAPFSFTVVGDAIEEQEESTLSEFENSLIERDIFVKVEGKVVNDNNGVGIANAEVSFTYKPSFSVSGMSKDGKLTLKAKTDKTGNYSIAIPRSQMTYEYTIKAEVKGYVLQKEEVSKFEESSKGVDIPMTPSPGIIAGKVFNSKTKTPVKNQIVALCTRDDMGALVKRKTASTDNQGNYSIEYDAGKNYLLLVEHDSYERYHSRAVIIEAEKTTNRDIPLTQKFGTIEGYVVQNLTDKPLYRSKVALYPAEVLKFNSPYADIDGGLPAYPTPIMATIETKPDGYFEFKNVPLNNEKGASNKFVVFAIADQHGNAWSVENMNPFGNKAYIQLDYYPLELVGTVKGMDNQPISLARIELYDLEGKLVRSTYTNGNGQYNLDSLDYTSYGKLVCYQQYHQTVVIDNPEIPLNKRRFQKDFQMEKDPRLTVRGHVIDQFGRPVVGVKVTCEGKEINTDAQGFFQIEKLAENKNKVLEFSYLGDDQQTTTEVKQSLNWGVEEVFVVYEKEFTFEFYDINGNPVESLRAETLDPSFSSVVSKEQFSQTWTTRYVAQPDWKGQELLLHWFHDVLETDSFYIEMGDREWFRNPETISVTVLPTMHKIRGKVLQEDGSPLAGVEVKLNGGSQMGKSNTDGIFLIENLLVRPDYDIIYEGAGFESKSQLVQGDITQPDDYIHPANDISLKLMVINPETLYGFKSAVTKLDVVSSGRFAIDGKLTLPTTSNMSVEAGEIPFEKIIIDENGIPLGSEPQSLGSALAGANLFNFPVSVQNPTIAYYNAAGNNISAKEAGSNGVGVITGKITFAETPVDQFDDSNLPEITFENTSGRPVGIYSSGQIEKASIQPNSQATAKFSNLELDQITGGFINTLGLHVEASSTIINQDTDITLVFNYKETQEHLAVVDASGKVQIEAEKQAFIFSANLAPFIMGSWVLETPELSIFSDKPSVTGDYSIRFFEDGSMQETTIKSDNFLFEMDPVTVVTDNYTFTYENTIGLTLHTKGGVLMGPFPQFIDVSLTMYERGGRVGKLLTPLSVPIRSRDDKLRAASTDKSKYKKGGIKGVFGGLNYLEIATGTGGDYWIADVDLGFDFGGGNKTQKGGGKQYIPPGAFKAGGHFKVYDDDNYELYEARLHVQMPSGNGFQGTLSMPATGGFGIDGDIFIASSPTEVMSIGGHFFYKSSDEWSVGARYSPKNPWTIASVPCDITTIRASLTRASNKWSIGFGGTIMMSPYLKSVIRFEGDGTLSFGKGHNTTLNLVGNLYDNAIGKNWGTATADIDFTAGTFEGSISSAKIDYTVVKGNATVNFAVKKGKKAPNVGKNLFLLEGEAYFKVLGQGVNTKFVAGNGLKETRWYLEMEEDMNFYKRLAEGKLSLKEFISIKKDYLRVIENQANTTNEEVRQALINEGLGVSYDDIWDSVFPFKYENFCMHNIAAARLSKYTINSRGGWVPLYFARSSAWGILSPHTDNIFKELSRNKSLSIDLGDLSGDVGATISVDKPDTKWSLGHRLYRPSDPKYSFIGERYLSTKVSKFISFLPLKYETTSSWVYKPSGALLEVILEDAGLFWGFTFSSDQAFKLLEDFGVYTTAKSNAHRQMISKSKKTKRFVEKAWKIQEQIRKAEQIMSQSRSQAQIKAIYKAKYETLRDYLNKVPISGIVCNMEANGGFSLDVDIGIASLDAGYEWGFRGELMMDSKLNANLDFTAGAKAWASFSLGDWNLAECSMSTTFKGNFRISEGSLSSVSGTGRGKISGHVGTKCGSCNSICIVGARGCADVKVSLKKSGSNISASISFD